MKDGGSDQGRNQRGHERPRFERRKKTEKKAGKVQPQIGRAKEAVAKQRAELADLKS